MNKINLKSQNAQNKTVQQIFDEAESGRVFLATQTIDNQTETLMKIEVAARPYLLCLKMGLIWTSQKNPTEYIKSLTPIDIEINQI